MKEEKKRYFLVEYYGIDRVCELEDRIQVQKAIDDVRKYNNRKSSKFLMGNISIDQIDGKFYLSAHLYRKYTNRSTISEIDELTSKMSETELINYFKEKSMMKNGALPDINIAYLETKNSEDETKKFERGIKYIPVLYKDDLKYMDEKYILECLFFHTETKDFDFFRDLAKQFSVYHFVADEIERLYLAIDKCEHQNEDLNTLYIRSKQLYSKFICEIEKDESLTRDENGKYQKSRRRIRDFGFFIKNYNIRNSKINSPLKYNKSLPKSEYIEEENGQLKLRLK